jgi:hypothetical protein
MSFVSVVPDAVTAASENLAGIGSSLRAAHAAAAAQTTAIAAPAADEVSAAIASFFGTSGREFQALGAQAAAFHDNFVSTLNAGIGQYVSAEVANVQQTLMNAVNAPAQALLGRPLIGTGQSVAGTAAATAAAFQSSTTQTINTLIGPITFTATGSGSILNGTDGPFTGGATGTTPLGNFAISLSGNALDGPGGVGTELQITGGSLSGPALTALVGLAGPAVTTQSALSNSISTFTSDLAAGNGVGALATLAAAPFDVTGAALGIGPTGTTTITVPLSSNPTVDLNIPVGGLLSPATPITATWPTFEAQAGGTTYQIDGGTVAFGGLQGGGPVSIALTTAPVAPIVAAVDGVGAAVAGAGAAAGTVLASEAIGVGVAIVPIVAPVAVAVAPVIAPVIATVDGSVKSIITALS